MLDITRMLVAAGAGDRIAAEELLPLVYDELRQLAAQRLAHERPGQTLDATALVHEAYLRLVPHSHDAALPSPGWEGRGHFFAAAAEAMRRILVENARRKGRVKHGGGRVRQNLETADCAAPNGAATLDLLVLDEALAALAAESPAKAALVKLRFFAGLTMAEVAVAQGISLATAERHWSYARTWLYAYIADRGEAAPGSEKNFRSE